MIIHRLERLICCWKLALSVGTIFPNHIPASIRPRLLLLFILCIVFGCGNTSDDDTRSIKVINKYVRKGDVAVASDHNGQHIIGLRLNKRSMMGNDNASEILPYLKKLPRLTDLKIGHVKLTKDDLAQIAVLTSLRSLLISKCNLDDDDLEFLQSLGELESLTLTDDTITDKGLQNIKLMTQLKHLDLASTRVRGPGLVHLKDLPELEWLDLGSTPLDDSAMPHIAANFPKLKRFDFGNTKVTPEGLMQLVDLHWLMTIGAPDDIVGPDYSQAVDRVERSKLIRAQRQAKVALFGEFRKRHIASKQKARAAGIDVPPDHVGPFGSSWSQYQEQLEKQDNTPPELKKD